MREYGRHLRSEAIMIQIRLFLQHLLFLIFIAIVFLIAGTMDYEDAIRAENANNGEVCK